MNGWFAMNRAMFSHPIFQKKPERVAAWAWILASAAWKDTEQDSFGKTVKVRRGQLLTSFRQMSEATGVSVKALRNLLERLKTEDAVGIDTGTGRLLITICNYDKYQDPSGSKGTGRGTAGAQQGHTKEQGNKGTTEEEAKASLSSSDDTSDAVKPFDEISQAVEMFNAAAKQSGWPKVAVLSKARRSALAARLRECGGLAGWDAALSRAQASNHCCGQNDRGWTVTFDFLAKQSSFAKLMEGNYDNRNRGPEATRASGSGSSMVGAFAAVAQRRAGGGSDGNR